MTVKTPLEARLYTALKRITQYDSPERMRRESEKAFGLDYEEALGYAYDNIQGEARDAIKGVRFPKPKATPAPTDQQSEAQ